MIGIKNCLMAIAVTGILCSCKKNTPNETLPTTEPIVFAPASANASVDFKGVNWADTRDNFADDELVLSGIGAADDYATVQTKAGTILAGFQNAGANTVRLPVNPSTVLGARWRVYKGAIDKASELGMKVVIAYWEGASSKDGMVDNTFSFWKMWDTVTTAYKAKGNVYFEVFNEPHGYSLTNLNSFYASFLSRYPALPRARVILDGAGYATDVNGVGADKRFDSCLLSFHFYTWFDNSKQTTADWEQAAISLNYPARTVVTEFGVPMSGGKDYVSAPGTDREIAYLQGMTNAMNALQIGSIYWPGLRTGDSYSLFTLSGSTIVTANASGLSRLRYAWQEEVVAPTLASFPSAGTYKIINKHSGKSLDVNNNPVGDGGTVMQWDYPGGTNQQWKFNALGNGYFSIVNKNSGKVLDVDGASKDAGKNIVQWSYAAGTNQQWQVIDIGFGYYKVINKNSALSLDINGQSTVNGGNAIQWHWNGGANQQWKISGL